MKEPPQISKSRNSNNMIQNREDYTVWALGFYTFSNLSCLLLILAQTASVMPCVETPGYICSPEDRTICGALSNKALKRMSKKNKNKESTGNLFGQMLKITYWVDPNNINQKYFPLSYVSSTRIHLNEFQRGRQSQPEPWTKTLCSQSENRRGI